MTTEPTIPGGTEPPDHDDEQNEQHRPASGAVVYVSATKPAPRQKVGHVAVDTTSPGDVLVTTQGGKSTERGTVALDVAKIIDLRVQLAGWLAQHHGVGETDASVVDDDELTLLRQRVGELERELDAADAVILAERAHAAAGPVDGERTETRDDRRVRLTREAADILRARGFLSVGAVPDVRALTELAAFLLDEQPPAAAPGPTRLELVDDRGRVMAHLFDDEPHEQDGGIEPPDAMATLLGPRAGATHRYGQ